MITKENIQKFLQNSPIAFAGVSRDKKKFTYVIFKELKKKGYQIIPINPNAEEIDGIKCFKDINSIPEKIDSILIAVPKSQTENIVSEAVKKGINNIFIQQSSETPEAIETAEGAGINLIYKECILMAAEPVNGIHKFHKFFATLFGKFPK